MRPIKYVIANVESLEYLEQTMKNEKENDNLTYQDANADRSPATGADKPSEQELGMLKDYADQRMEVGEMARRMKRTETWIRHNAVIYNIMLDF